MRSAIILLTIVGGLAMPLKAADDGQLFREKVAPIFERRCLSCHNDHDRKGRLSLETAKAALAGGESGAVIEPGDAEASILLDYISGSKPEMPKDGPPLSAEQIAVIRQWIAGGAKWPVGLKLADNSLADSNWWSLLPLERPPLPQLSNHDSARAITPIDTFILAKLREKGLALSPPADRRTLIRRLYFDLLGLPPSPGEVDSFINDDDPQAYERLVDRLLDSPHYGERWARHWLDVVHYGDTHGYDKDKLRPNAWPYRDYVIRAFNENKPYDRFVREQLAGDYFYPNTRDGVVALGFIAAGPFDFVGQMELREGTIDKEITRNLDRDDMVATAMNTFTSLTVQCARCHNHKFDPITQEDYYSLQAVFAAVDRADRPYDADPKLAERRAELLKQRDELAAKKQQIDAKLAGPELAAIDTQIEQLAKQSAGGEKPEFGYHSLISATQNAVKWVQVDLGRATPIAHIVYVGCHDNFNNINAGFGFPVRYKIEISDDAKFAAGVTVVADFTQADVPNPGVRPQSIAVEGKTARYVRVTATKLAPRKDDYIFALAELSVLTPQGVNAAAGAEVTSLDSIQAPVRWQRKNLVDGYYYGVSKVDHLSEIAKLNDQRRAILDRALDAATKKEAAELEQAMRKVESQMATLPAKGIVYAAATDFAPNGNFRPTGGWPREIHLLLRGSEKNRGPLMSPGTVSCVAGLPARFDLSAEHNEAQRRAALANWLVDKKNPLTWRSIVNRVWLYHFGRGIVDTPNDFGRMGSLPTHPELLDWLAVEFRDGGQSIKQLHRLIVNSATYRQTSFSRDPAGGELDAGNQFLWRQNRQRLEAESIHDAVLAVSGKLDGTMFGPGYKPFGFKDDHSPHYLYAEHDPDDPASHRRSIYRFIVRSVPDPFMETLDCADPSLLVPKRNETLTALQALALLNNKFMVRMSQHFATRVETMATTLPDQIAAAYRLALGRSPTANELQTLVPVAEKHGLANICRLIFNTNEFVFVD
jgi:hypothetical protein